MKLLILSLCLVGAAATTCRQNFCSVGGVEDSLEVPVMLAIKQRNLDVLEKMFWEVSNPESPKYGKYLSHAEVGALTSSPKKAAAVVAYFLDMGVSEVSATAHGDFVELTMNVRLAERLFNAKYETYQHLQQSRRVIHRSLKHTVPAAIAEHVDFVAHVSDFPQVQGPIFASKSVLRGNKGGVGPNDVAVVPATIKSAYNIQDSNGKNPRNSMGVFETTQDYSPSDLSTFESNYNLPSEKVAKVIGPNTAWICDFSVNSCGEASLDVQYIMSTARNISLTFWSISGQDQTPFYDWIVAVSKDATPPLVNSMSYGMVEQKVSASLIQRTNTEFQKMGVRGVTVVIASGDDGAAGSGARGNTANCGFNPSWPATSPYITAVGATQFKNGNPSDGEIPCQSNNSPASLITSGGGFSSIFSAPSYQSAAVQNYFNTASSLPPTTSDPTKYPSPGFNKAGRGYPDVAALGHNYQIVVGGRTVTVDGTSAAAPVFAGVLALLNDARMNKGESTLGFVNPLLYKLADSAPSVFNQIDSGSDACTAQGCCPHGFVGASGWDPLSGLGTPNFPELLANI